MSAQRSGASGGSVEHAAHLADCAWCGQWFANIVELLSHVDENHLDGHLSTLDAA